MNDGEMARSDQEHKNRKDTATMLLYDLRKHKKNSYLRNSLFSNGTIHPKNAKLGWLKVS